MRLCMAVAATVAIALTSACSGVTGSAPPNTAPRFADTVRDRTYFVGSITCTVDLPEASGGNGRLVYRLTPAVPGWHFDRAKRTLAVPTTTAGAWEMTYRVEDSDEDSTDSDADALTFMITINQPGAGIATMDSEGGISSEYQGCGNQVFVLNPDGNVLADTTYTVELHEAAASVYLIATNTTTGDVTPNVERLDNGQEAAPAYGQRGGVESPNLRLASAAIGSSWSLITEFNNTPPSMMMAGASSSRFIGQPPTPAQPPPVAAGNRFTFIGFDFGEESDVEVAATARKVVSDGTITLAVWVADTDWGSCSLCVQQEMVDAIADGFLRPGDENDIYDWVTAIFGDPWGQHESPYLIPAAYAEQIHILIYDIDNDGLETEAPSGYYSSSSSYLSSNHGRSNERLLFFADAPRMVDEWHPKRFYGLLAHEFQHMINFYQKVVTYDVPSEAWINEMCSEVAEDFVADKIQINGPRGVDHDDPTAGDSESYGQLSTYNYYNFIQSSKWEFDAPLYRYYAINYALGAYLARTYGGAPLFGAIVRSDQSGVDAIEAALAGQGHSVNFEDVLTNWAAANLLSDDPRAEFPYRYNTGTWSISEAGGTTFRLGSINLFNYRYEFGEGPNDYYAGPYLFSISDFSDAGEQPPHSNRYADLGRNTGTVRLRISAAEGNRISVVVKE